MKIKSFNSFLESKNKEYDIYQFFADLHPEKRNKFSLDELKENCDHFVGDGWFKKISDKVDWIIKSCDKVNLKDVELRLYDDLYDNISLYIEKTLSFCILSGDYDRYDEENDRKYSSTHFFLSGMKHQRKYIISDIIRDVIYPTLFIDDILIRNTEESQYVTDSKWNCSNFDIKNYNIIDQNNYIIKQKSKYTTEKVVDMFKPAIVCRLEGDYGKEYTKMNMDKIEGYMDEALECILPTIDYEAVIFDYSRYKRQFENKDTYDYTLKIILK